MNITTSNNEYVYPEYLVEMQWLEQHLDDPQLWVFDCSAFPGKSLDNKTNRKFPVLPQGGRQHYE